MSCRLQKHVFLVRIYGVTGDLITPDFFLWSYVKERVFHNIKRTTYAIKKNINN